MSRLHVIVTAGDIKTGQAIAREKKAGHVAHSPFYLRSRSCPVALATGGQVDGEYILFINEVDGTVTKMYSLPQHVADIIRDMDTNFDYEPEPFEFDAMETE